MNQSERRKSNPSGWNWGYIVGALIFLKLINLGLKLNESDKKDSQASGAATASEAESKAIWWTKAPAQFRNGLSARLSPAELVDLQALGDKYRFDTQKLFKSGGLEDSLAINGFGTFLVSLAVAAAKDNKLADSLAASKLAAAIQAKGEPGESCSGYGVHAFGLEASGKIKEAQGFARIALKECAIAETNHQRKNSEMKAKGFKVPKEFDKPLDPVFAESLKELANRK